MTRRTSPPQLGRCQAERRAKRRSTTFSAGPGAGRLSPVPRVRHTTTLATLASLLVTLVACLAAPDGEVSKPAGTAPGSTLADLAEIAKERRLRAGFLIVDGVYNTELTAP